MQDYRFYSYYKGKLGSNDDFLWSWENLSSTFYATDNHAFSIFHLSIPLDRKLDKRFSRLFSDLMYGTQILAPVTEQTTEAPRVVCQKKETHGNRKSKQQSATELD